MIGSLPTGSHIPNVKLGYVSDDGVASVYTDELFSGRRTIVLGVPGAFTPVCSQQHLPDFIANAERLVQSGFQQLVCIAPNDPFVLDEWRVQLDPLSKLRFLSDGNLDFCNALGLCAMHSELFMGRRSQRYLLIVHDRTIQRVRVEPNILSYTCTRSEDVFLAA